MRSERTASQRNLLRVIGRATTGGRLAQVASGGDSGAAAGTGYPGAGDADLDDGAVDYAGGGTITSAGLPKFVAGHPVLGAFHTDAVILWEM